ncbi:5'-methylthioadenosine/S-adenosylhomocysteine nucleosidase family protein [Allokutzneria oryzae]|uniref:Nucleoside phosphorylase domain-containing protein n=1 Tax=Allokutzneria oryzae TaxID=1378989 RepID=A0ABV6A6P6_9PSEU
MTRPAAVICTALAVEYNAVRAHLAGEITEHSRNGTLYEVGAFGRWTVALLQAGMGNVSTSQQLERAVAEFSPELALFVGVAGGRKDVGLGDVVAADVVYDYESGKDTESGYRPRIKTHPSSHRLVQRAQSVARQALWHRRILPSCPAPAPQAVCKPIAAGGKVISHGSSATARQIDQNCGDAAAVDMEGFGFLSGAHALKDVEALVIRGISDLLSDKSFESDQRWQPVASAAAAAFAFEVLHREEPQRDPAPPAQTNVISAQNIYGNVIQAGSIGQVHYH